MNELGDKVSSYKRPCRGVGIKNGILRYNEILDNPVETTIHLFRNNYRDVTCDHGNSEKDGERMRCMVKSESSENMFCPYQDIPVKPEDEPEEPEAEDEKLSIELKKRLVDEHGYEQTEKSRIIGVTQGHFFVKDNVEIRIITSKDNKITIIINVPIKPEPKAVSDDNYEGFIWAKENKRKYLEAEKIIFIENINDLEEKISQINEIVETGAFIIDSNKSRMWKYLKD